MAKAWSNRGLKYLKHLLTSLTMIPPRLCTTKIIGRLFYVVKYQLPEIDCHIRVIISERGLSLNDNEGGQKTGRRYHAPEALEAP